MTLCVSTQRITLQRSLPRSSHSLSVVGSKAYLFGGELRPREPVDSVLHVFPINTESLAASNDTTAAKQATTQGGTTSVATREISDRKEGDSWPTARVGHTAARVGDDIYVFGGRGGEDMKPLDEAGRVWQFSTGTEQWTALDPVNNETRPEARSYHSSTGASDVGKVFIHAGCPASGRQGDLWSFDISKKIWQQLPRAPDPPRGGPGFTYGMKKLWRYGGFDGKNELGGQLDYIDVTKPDEDWTSVSYKADECPGPRSVTGLHILTVKGQDFLVTFLGERDASNLGHAGAGVFWGDVWALALSPEGVPKEEKWIKCESQGKIPERGWFGSDVVGENTIMVYGGLNASNEREKDAILLTLS